MTLCAAWVRETEDSKELIFATDSCLGGGERWDSGIKLFELPRKDCVICFSGYTLRTYPLILSLINSLRYDKYASNTNYDISELVHYITDVFTDLIKQIKLSGSQTLHSVLKGDPAFEFIFGGWSWKSGDFKLWRLHYSYDANGFIAKTDYSGLIFMWTGDEIEEATKRLADEISNAGKILSGRLDMEPLSVLVKIIREPSFDTISGPIQLTKIYPPGRIESFGMYYPSIEGYKTFMGRNVSKTNNPAVRFIDPDTGSIVDNTIPIELPDVELDDLGVELEYVKDYYPNGKLKADISEKEKDLLVSIFKEKAYKRFLQGLEENITDSAMQRDTDEQ